MDPFVAIPSFQALKSHTDDFEVSADQLLDASTDTFPVEKVFIFVEELSISCPDIGKVNDDKLYIEGATLIVHVWQFVWHNLGTQ